MTEAAGKKSILFVLPSLSGGGAERVITTLLQHLDRSLFRLILVVVNMRDAVYLSNIPSDVEVIDLNGGRVRYAFWKILVTIRARRPDVVFTTLGYLNMALAIMRPLLPSAARYIAREASMASRSMYLHSMPRVMAWLYKRVYKRFDWIVCQSEQMRSDLVQTYDVPLEKIVVIANPIDVDIVKARSLEGCSPAEFKSGLFNVVAAGRLSYEKGMDLLLLAISLCGDIPINLVILGEGPLRKDLEQQIIDLKISERVSLVGFQLNPYVYFAHADLFVLSSRVEGFPNVVLEAIACGVPVVATPCAELLDDIVTINGNGWLATDISSTGLAEVLHVAYKSPRRVVNVRQLRAQFDVREIVGEYEKLLMR